MVLLKAIAIETYKETIVEKPINFEIMNPNDEVNITVQSPPVDNEKPNISITTPTEDQIFPEGTLSVEMRGTASDNVAVILVELSNDGTVWTPAIGTTNWNGSVMVQTGANTLYARARDAASNTRTAIVNIH